MSIGGGYAADALVIPAYFPSATTPLGQLKGHALQSYLTEAAQCMSFFYFTATGRHIGTIENGTTFAYGDGRRIALEECLCRRLTDEDYASPRRKKKSRQS
jgi:hypothetical protein